MGLPWVLFGFAVFGFLHGFWTVISARFGFIRREVKIRERREMGENRYNLGIYYFIG